MKAEVKKEKMISPLKSKEGITVEQVTQELTVQADSLSELIFKALEQAEAASVISSPVQNLYLESKPISEIIGLTLDITFGIEDHLSSSKKRRIENLSFSASYHTPLVPSSFSGKVLELLKEFGGDRYAQVRVKVPEKEEGKEEYNAGAFALPPTSVEITSTCYGNPFFPRKNKFELQGIITPEVIQNLKSLSQILGIKHSPNEQGLPRLTRQWFSRGPTVEEQFLAYQEAQRQGWKEVFLFSAAESGRSASVMIDYGCFLPPFLQAHPPRLENFLSYSFDYNFNRRGHLTEHQLQKSNEFVESKLGISFSEQVWNGKVVPAYEEK